MYSEFTWWTGVVEDRVDPLKLGRCRVRILGYHTDKKDVDHIPTNTLPWATPMQPITSAAMNGIGTTPMGPVEGTWIVGFFRDGHNAQDPVMMGTIGGIPESGPDPSLGFNDPKGVYPRPKTDAGAQGVGEADTNRLARGIGVMPLGTKNGENSLALQHKRATRQKNVPIAIAGDMSTKSGGDTIENDPTTPGLYEAADWFEPNPRYGGATDSDTTYYKEIGVYNKETGTLEPEDGLIASKYPHNHVRQSESGHIEEWDDTPTAERLHRYHKTGTFEEIQPDGTKVTKVVKDEYEITLGLKDVWIQGAVNVTIGSDTSPSDCRLLYYGNLVQEVYGNYHLHVRGDKRTKILGNEITEVGASTAAGGGDRKIVINGHDDLFVAKNQFINIGKDHKETIGGTLSQNVTGKVDETYQSTMSTNVKDDTVWLIKAKLDIGSDDDMGIGTKKDMNIAVVGDLTEEVVGAVEETYHQTHTITVTGAVDETYGSTWDNITTGAIDITSDATIDFFAAGHFDVIGSPINLN